MRTFEFFFLGNFLSTFKVGDSQALKLEVDPRNVHAKQKDTDGDTYIGKFNWLICSFCLFGKIHKKNGCESNTQIADKYEQRIDS